MQGTIAFCASGGAELVLDTGKAIPVPASLLHGALPGDRVRAALLPPRGGRRPAADVREILQRGPGQIVGIFHRAGRGGWVEPREPELFPYYLAIATQGDAGDAEEGDLVVAELSAPPLGGARVTGRILDVLGDPDDPRAEVAAIAYHHGLRLEFPEDVAREVARIAPEVQPEELRGRTDLRSEPFVTIDGEDARDFDDAVLVRRENRGALLRVAIADVSHYVHEGSALDREAAERGTSVYFPDRVLPMLPHELSSGICSLHPEVDRLVLCVDLHIDARGEVQESRFYEGVIRSHARLTYSEVWQAIEAGRPVRGAGDLRPMVDLCEVLNRRRRERGSIDFDIPEARVILDEHGEVQDVLRRERNLAHRLIEEFMIAANEAVARHFELAEHPTVFRVHDRPDPEKIRAFCELAGALGLHLRPEDADEPRKLAQFVQAMGERPGARALHALLLRSMKQATYDVENIGHFGLATEEYLHFTSPIRRYPDLLVHRLLRRLLRGRGPQRDEAKKALSDRLSDLAVQSSARERAALEAEREVLAFYRSRLMARHIGEIFEGNVVGVVPFGIFVELAAPFVDGLVHVQSLGDDFFQFNEEAQRLTGASTGRSFTLGDAVRVRVVDASVPRRQVTFELAPDGEERRHAAPRERREKAPAAEKRRRPRPGKRERRGRQRR